MGLLKKETLHLKVDKIQKSIYMLRVLTKSRAHLLHLEWDFWEILRITQRQ